MRKAGGERMHPACPPYLPRSLSHPAPACSFRDWAKKVVDNHSGFLHTIVCCFDVRRYLSWIEGLTTNQYVGGSNPSRRTIFSSLSATTGNSTCGFFMRRRVGSARTFFLRKEGTGIPKRGRGMQDDGRNIVEGSKTEASQYVTAPSSRHPWARRSGGSETMERHIYALPFSDDGQARRRFGR